MNRTAALTRFTAPIFTPLKAIADMAELWKQRRSLAELDQHLLCDLGLTSQAAAREARRPLWDVPTNWRG